MPDKSPTSEAGGPFDAIPLGIKLWSVAGWVGVVGLTYWGAHLLGWSLEPRGDARSPLFLLIPTLLYWPALRLAIWHLRSDRQN